MKALQAGLVSIRPCGFRNTPTEKSILRRRLSVKIGKILKPFTSPAWQDLFSRLLLDARTLMVGRGEARFPGTNFGTPEKFETNSNGMVNVWWQSMGWARGQKRPPGAL